MRTTRIQKKYVKSELELLEGYVTAMGAHSDTAITGESPSNRISINWFLISIT